MNDLVTALGPAFAAGFAVQQFLELIDPLFGGLTESAKKIVFSVLALGLGFVLTLVGGFEVLEQLADQDIPDALDVLVTALVISAGTEGFNEILKFLGYAKQNEKKKAGVK